MANALNGNTFFVDTVGTLELGNAASNIKVIAILFTATATGGTMTIKDNASSGPITKTVLSGPNDNETKFFDLSSSPLVFPNGITVTSVTNANATMVFTR